MSLLLTLLSIAMPQPATDFKILAADGTFTVFSREPGTARRQKLQFYTSARLAKSYRKAIDWAINDQDMNANAAVIYAIEKARDEANARLETDEPDEHFEFA